METSIQHLNNVVEIKTSKTDHPVPVVNDVHLHSIYNPEREAESFVSGNEQTLKKGSQVLIFGLGFGYHIEKVEQRLKALYQEDYRVFVIEPNNELIKKWKELRPTMFSSRVKVVHYESVKDFYKDRELVEFLSNKPAILPHPASFQLNDSFYKSFMSFHYPTSIDESLPFVDSTEFCHYLKSEGGDETTEEFFERVKKKPFIKGYDFLSLALSEIVNSK